MFVFLTHGINRCGPTGRPRPASGPTPHLTRHEKSFINFLLFTTNSFIFISRNDFKNSQFLSHLLLYARVSLQHVLLILKPYRQMPVVRYKLCHVQLLAGANLKYVIL